MAKIFKHKTDVAYFDYKDFKTLQRYVNTYGQIEGRKKTGLTESQQRRLLSPSSAPATSHCYRS